MVESSSQITDKKNAAKQKAQIYVRIRPEATEGGHLATEQIGTKKLEGWTEEEVTIGDTRTGKLSKYTYPIAVIGPEKT